MNDAFLPLRVKSLTWEAVDVLSLHLEDPQGALPSWTPGSHIDLQFGPSLIRQYSLCGPADAAHWRVAVLREPDGKGGSAYVHDVLRPGAVVPVRGPPNHFELHDAPAYLFIAGGIGITPILAMVRDAERRGVCWSLAYGGRRRDSMAFLSELAQYGDRVSLYPADEMGWMPLEQLLSEEPASSLVYCCGPPPLIAAVQGRCASDLEARLHVERFVAYPESPVEHCADEAGFTVLLDGSGTQFEVPPGVSILETLEQAGVAHPNSCREGICGTCETPVLEGELDHRDSLLEEDERAAGDTMLICVSRCLGKCLVLDL